MNLSAINRAIRRVCYEVRSLCNDNPDWRLFTEEELLYEATICIFSSQMIFEVAVEAANKVKANQLLHRKIFTNIPTNYHYCPVKK